MNRSILIVIADFLLLNLLIFGSFDTDKIKEQGGDRQVKAEFATNQTDSRQDLGNVMRLALNEERKGRDQLLSELAKSRDAAARQQTLLSERDQQVQTFQQALQTREQEAMRLHQQQTNLQQQYAAAQTNLEALNEKLQNSSKENVLSRENLAATEAEARRQSDQTEALRKQLDQLAKSNQLAMAEKQQLTGQLQLAEAEKRSAAELARRMQDEVKIEREEKFKLAEGVKALASKSSELVQEIRENRPLAPNTIFNDFLTNRVQARFDAVRSTLFGIDGERRRETETVLVSDGSNTFALCHVQDTPLTLWTPGTDWEGLTGSLNRGGTNFPISYFSFYALDPRVVLMPVPQAQVRSLGCKVYHISADPFKFQDAVVVGAREGYYGECKFELDLSTPQYVRMDHNSLKGLFGKFNPSRGDLVFSKNGDLLGIMANSTYCMLIQNFSAGPTIQFGPDIRAQRTGVTLSMLAYAVQELPFKLQ